MRILFVHQNFPAQFRHLAPALAQRGHEVRALQGTEAPGLPNFGTFKYKYDAKPPDPAVFKMATDSAERFQRAHVVMMAAAELRQKTGYVPDIVFGHIGWGETLFLKEVWPEAKHLLYAEFFYGTKGRDVDFDPEFPELGPHGRARVITRQAALLLALNGADHTLAPTQWQASTFPMRHRDTMSVIHDGIDTHVVTPSQRAVFAAGPGLPKFKAGDEVITFVNRSLEPYRGYHIFLRALPEVLAKRPNAHVVIVGGDGVSYSRRPADGRSWKETFLGQVKDRLEMSRVHFVGRIPYPAFLDLMRVSRVHAYLTYPFVLSWSMLEAMSAGALVIGSRTPPVEEVISHGVNGLLVDFFDVAGWSRALIDALAEPERYTAIRSAARQTIVERYDLRTQCLPRLVKMVEATAG
jgi:glycosyltransferase involved in cell wall biosynthesis